MATKTAQHSAAIGVVLLLLVASSASGLAYYQYVVLPSVGQGAAVPEFILHPPQNITVRMVQGSYNPTHPENYVPKDAKVVLGVNNTVLWVNEEEIPHTVTSVPNAPDSRFEEKAATANYMRLKETFTFTFTKPGVYTYYCTPHAGWMRGTITVLPPISNATRT